METTGEVSNIKRIFLCNRPLYNFFCSTLDTSPVDSIWLEMAINWHTKSQGPKKKCAHFSWGRIHSCPAGTACNQGSFTSMALLSVQSFLSSTVCTIKTCNAVTEREFCQLSESVKFLKVWSLIKSSDLSRQTMDDFAYADLKSNINFRGFLEAIWSQ